MESFIKIIEKKIKSNIDAKSIEVIDNSHKHRGHKNYQENKLHLKIVINSDHLKSLDRIQAHKKIMKILKNEIKEKIHALELKIN
jgi:BolA protein|tara:strand:- start:3999 stop:4253 length:255 start_codon:yes stop_codon:yes gene_type:complete